MTTNMYIPFTYHICWTKYNFHYYGVKFADGCHPNDLWNPYKTSSKAVKALLESIGDPDIIEPRKEFKTMEEAIRWEERVLKRLGVTKRDDWLNECDCFPCCDNRGRKNGMYGKKHSTETRKKISDSNMGRTSCNKGKTFSTEHKQKLSLALKGHLVSEETKRKISESKIGRKHTDETKKKMSDSSKGQVAWNKGIPCGEETKRKISQVNMGRIGYNKGNTHSAETKKKMSESHRKRREQKN